jgi:3',5'-cyclic-AMP phosphodiesterase
LAALSTILAQISDPHVSANDPGSAAALAAAVEEIGRLEAAPTAVLLSGDLTDTGEPRDYDLLRELLEPLAMPVHPLPGNHDDRDALRAAFGDHAGIASAGAFLQYTVRCGPLRLVVCDTIEPGREGGRLCDERLGWLATELSSDGGPAVLAMHHPPMSIGVRELDEIGLEEGARAALGELLAGAPGLERIVAGHMHRAVSGQLAGSPVFVCPSVYLQARLDLSEHGRLSLVHEPPALGLHVHRDGEALISHVQPIGDYPAVE